MKELKPVINEFGYCDENCGKEIVSLSFTSYLFHYHSLRCLKQEIYTRMFAIEKSHECSIIQCLKLIIIINFDDENNPRDI